MNRFITRVFAFCLVGLFLVMSFVVAEDSIGPYNPTADVNRDGVVDILDLVEVGQLYGSTYAPTTQPNRTSVTVLLHAANLSCVPIANALVVVYFDEFRDSLYGGDGSWGYTDSSGMVNFELSGNTSFVAIAWNDDRSMYNYATFTTNPSGEASVTVWLNHLASPCAQPDPSRTIPKGWIVIIVFDNNTGRPYTYAAEQGKFLILRFKQFELYYNMTLFDIGMWWIFGSYSGTYAINATSFKERYGWYAGMAPLTSNVIGVWDASFGGYTTLAANVTYCTDEYCGALVTTTIYRYW